MTTDYYLPRLPITSLRLTEGPGHDRLEIWVEHALAGELVLPRGKGGWFAQLLHGDEPAGYVMCPGKGKTVLRLHRNLPDQATLVSSSAKVITVGDLKKCVTEVRCGWE